MKKSSAYLRLLRPHQWIKNAFVLVGLIFGHAWANPVTVFDVCLAMIAFCFMSSTVYIYNDIIDLHADRNHPHKKKRPIASGRISTPEAMRIAFILLVAALVIGVAASHTVAFILIAYLILNILYSHWLKHIVILDVFIISAGFMLRILAGTIGVGIIPSQWLMFCGLMLTLFLGFTKRRAEMIQQQDEPHLPRKVLKDYQQVILDKMISITASCSIIGYGLYTMNDETIAIHHTNNLIYTIPFVIYGIFRYLFLLHRPNDHTGQDISKDLWTDKHLAITVILWFLLILLIIT